MTKSSTKKILGIQKKGTIKLILLTFIVITQIPGAIKNMSEIACIGQASNEVWQKEGNHSEANMLAVRMCNGRI